MFPGFVFVVALAQLLLDLFGDQVYGSVEITFDIFSEQVGPGKRDPNGAGKCALGRSRAVVLHRHADIGGIVIEMIEFVDPAD